MNEAERSTTLIPDAPRDSVPTQPTPAPPPRTTAASGRGRWTGGRITALVIGVVLALASLGLLAGGGTALWADVALRDNAGYVTTDVRGFSTDGAALVSESIDLGSPGVGWFYSRVALGDVRIRVTPSNAGSPVFVGIAPTAVVDRYLGGIRHTVISDFWTDRLANVGGDATASAPTTQRFWLASTSGAGPRTVSWEPENGSWTVVVMNADGRPGVDVRADLGATMPALLPTAIVALILGATVGVGASLLIVGAIRRVRRADVV
jgi:hypothetical protein